MTQKQRLLALTGGALALAAAIGLYSWYGIYQAGITKQKQQDVQDSLFTFKKEQVKTIALTSNGQTVEATRQDKGWSIGRPIKTAADDFAFDSIADKMASLKQKRDIGDQTDLSQFGLNPPRAKVVVTLDDGTSAELDLGSDNTYDATLYAKRGGDARVSILEPTAKGTFDRGLFDLREKRILVFDDASLRHIDVAMPELSYGIEHTPQGVWMVTAPNVMPGDSQKCSQIMGDLQHMRATRFAADDASQADLARFGLDKPSGTVQIVLNDNVQKTLSFSAQRGEGTSDHVFVKVTDQPYIAEVPASGLKDLAVSLADLKDKTILRFDDNTVSQFQFKVGSTQFVALKHASGDAGPETWTVSGGPDGGLVPAKKWKLSALANQLRDLRGTKLLTDKSDDEWMQKTGLANPTKVITILGKDGQGIGKLVVGKTEGSDIDVKLDGATRIYQIDATKLANAPNSPADVEENPPTPDGGAAVK